MEQKKNYINGEWVAPASGEYIEVENPATQEIIAKIPKSGKEDVDKAVNGAAEAFFSWSKKEPKERLDLLKKAIQIMMDNADDLAKTVQSELGAPKDFAKKTHVDGNLEQAMEQMEMAESLEYKRDEGDHEVWMEPYGVVACLTPWNYPLGQITSKVIPALAMGNTVVLKPSSQTPLTAYRFTEALIEAGIPSGVFQMVCGSGSDVGDPLAGHDRVNMVTFTGSTAGGAEIAKTASEGVKQVILELGGKSPALVLEGADLELVSKRVLNTIVNNTGQSCNALTRLIAPRSMKEEVEQALLERLQQYKVGNPEKEEVSAGPVQSKKQFDKVKGFIEKGVEEGAKILTGEVPKGDNGYIIQPVIFTEVDNQMEIAQEEIFGPVLSVIYYDSEEEGIEIANDTKYGLASAVFGPDDKAKEAASRIRAGNCAVNEGKSPANAPFGGYKHSGYGREGGKYGLMEFLQTKAIFR